MLQDSGKHRGAAAPAGAGVHARPGPAPPLAAPGAGAPQGRRPRPRPGRGGEDGAGPAGAGLPLPRGVTGGGFLDHAGEQLQRGPARLSAPGLLQTSNSTGSSLHSELICHGVALTTPRAGARRHETRARPAAAQSALSLWRRRAWMLFWREQGNAHAHLGLAAKMPRLERSLAILARVSRCCAHGRGARSGRGPWSSSGPPLIVLLIFSGRSTLIRIWKLSVLNLHQNRRTLNGSRSLCRVQCSPGVQGAQLQ